MHSQNLVPNPSFEQNTSCPAFAGHMAVVVDWINPVTFSSSDYFHSCNGGTVGVPSNVMGYQEALDGSAFVGLATYSQPAPEFRDLVQAQLLSSLTSGRCYAVGMYVAPTNVQMFGADGLGGLFSATAVTGTQTFMISFDPSFEQTPGVAITDTIGWTMILDHYVADGTEQYLTLGNFRDDAELTLDTIDASSSSLVAYYYIDNAFVIPVPPADAGPDQIACNDPVLIGMGMDTLSPSTYSWQPSNGLSDTTSSLTLAFPDTTTTYTLTKMTPCDTTTSTVTVYSDDSGDCDVFEIYPNPSFGQPTIHYTLSGEVNEIYLYDVQGKLVLKEELTRGFNQTGILDVRGVSPGLYIYKVFVDGNEFSSDKIIIQVD